MAQPLGDQPSVQQLLAQIVQLQAALVEQQAQQRQGSPGVGNPSEPKANPPDTFNGKDPAALERFIMQCETVFKLQPSKFSGDTHKVMYVISFLRGFVLDAIQPLATGRDSDLNENGEHVEAGDYLDEKIRTYAGLRRYLRENFGDPDAKGTARRKYFSLRQTGSAAEYFAKIREYTSVLSWELDEQATARAKEGLSDVLQDEVARHPKEFETFAELQAFVVRLDNSLRAREAEKNKAENRREKKKTVLGGNNGGSTAVTSEVGAAATNPRPSPGPTTSSSLNSAAAPRRVYPPRPRLTPDEHERRGSQGLCFKCGNAGHLARDCPGSFNPGQRVKQEPQGEA